MTTVWLITNAARGLGRTLAEAVLRAGGKVVAGAREPARLAPLIARYGARMRAVELDVADEATLYAAVDETLMAFGRIDVVVNPIGEPGVGAGGEMSDTDLRAQFETGFFGFAAVAHAVLPILREQRSGRLVQIVAHGDDDALGRAAHRATQAALKSYFAALASDVAAEGVDVDIVEPGAMLAETIGRMTTTPLLRFAGDDETGASRVKPSARVVRFSVHPEAA